MSNKAAGITVSAVLALLAALVAVARRARTEHPPVAAEPPRIES
ncbi:hypothetical protein [Gordonia iterans]|nr:hypothetical protein [Gordonia iterans]